MKIRARRRQTSDGIVPRAVVEACMVAPGSYFKDEVGISCCEHHNSVMPGSFASIATVLSHLDTGRLRHLRIVTMGDSLTGQFRIAWSLMMKEDVEQPSPVRHVEMPIIPHRQFDLDAKLLEAIAGGPDVLVIGLGSAYRMERRAVEGAMKASASWTKDVVGVCGNAHFGAGSIAEYIENRSSCLSVKGRYSGLGRMALVSDIKRFIISMNTLQGSNVKLPLVLWLSLPAHHVGPQANGKCIKAKTFDPASQFNSMAHRALHDFLVPAMKGAPPRLYWVDVHANTQSYPHLHAGLQAAINDCHHWCNPSVVTWYMVIEIMKTILKARDEWAKAMPVFKLE